MRFGVWTFFQPVNCLLRNVVLYVCILVHLQYLLWCFAGNLCVCNLYVDSHISSHKHKKHKNKTALSEKWQDKLGFTSKFGMLFLASTSSSSSCPSYPCLFYLLLFILFLYFHFLPLVFFLFIPPIIHAPHPLLLLFTPPPSHHCHRHPFTCHSFPNFLPGCFIQYLSTTIEFLWDCQK